MQTVTVTLIVATILTNYVAGYLFHGKTFLKSPQDDLNDHEFRSPRSLNGSKLMLTPLIARGEVKRARHLANVDKHHFLNVTSFAGYLTVNETTDSNMWFWFFPAEHVTDFYNDTEASAYEVNTKPKGDLKDVPLVLWLQGGPGCTSMFALFEENGPFIVNDDYSLKKNEFSWHRNYSMLYIDNPVGTGFSYTNGDGYATNTQQISSQLHIALVQFLKLFPEYQLSPFFVSGESYAGKYIPAIGFEIYKNNKMLAEFGANDLPINLKGLFMGNALTDPRNMLDYSKFAYENGLVDIHGMREMESYEKQAKESLDLVKGGEFWDKALAVFSTRSAYTNMFNILKPREDPDTFPGFITQPHIREALKVGDQQLLTASAIVYNSLRSDRLNTATHWLRTILDETDTRVLYYSGNKDLIVAYPLSVNFYQNFEWTGAEAYRNAEREFFYVNDELAGYIKKANRFAEACILNAGHMVPTDQPEVALQLLQRFIDNKL